jgi:quercetin dioxygenase-like cupin family protein
VSTFSRLNELAPIQVWGGTVGRAVQGEQITLAVLDLAAGEEVPEHQHPNEQVGLVLKGQITMIVAGESRSLGPGETYVIPGGVPHGASSGPEGCSVIDTFSPVRRDWDALPRLEPSPGRWP